MPNKNIILVGGGRFGKLALERIPDRIAIVAEQEPEEQLVELVQTSGAELWNMDAIEALKKALHKRKNRPEWVIPAAPLHVLARWIAAELEAKKPQFGVVPEELIPDVKMVHRGEGGEAYLSLADFMCPDDCPEPVEICTHTGNPRGTPMYRRISDLNTVGIQVGVLRSLQLAPGVGGMPVHEMQQLRQEVKRTGGEWLLATACRCHGVLSYIDFQVNTAK